VTGSVDDPLQLYAVATDAVAQRLPTAPLGVPLRLRFDPMRVDSAPFLERLARLDREHFGAAGMRTPRWALYDCGEAVGAVLGFAARTAEGPDPVSLLIALPTVRSGAWLLTTLGAADRDARLLGPTLAIGRAALGDGPLTAVTQWAGAELPAYAAHAPLALRAAWLPAHDVPATAVVEIGASGRIDRIERWIDPADEGMLHALHRRLEAGEPLAIAGSPEGGRYPLGALS
jgi:hypothetical protein